MNIEITPEMIQALRTLRDVARTQMAEIKVVSALNVLDDAGIFAAIDEATGYDVESACTCPPENVKFGGHLYHCPGDPEPKRVSKCTCPRSRAVTPTPLGDDMHTAGCPGDPEPKRVSKCTCAPGAMPDPVYHFPNCPGDPAERDHRPCTTR